MGLCLYLVNHIDSVRVIVSQSLSVIDTAIVFIPKQKDTLTDTIWYTLVFSEPGNRTIIATGYVGKSLRPSAGATIQVLARPTPNRKPLLTVTGNRTVIAGKTCTLAVSAIDPDVGQTVAIDTLRCPAGSRFHNDTLTWATTLADTGSDTVVFIATDNAAVPLSDTEIVKITVTPPGVNHPPKWAKDTIIRIVNENDSLTIDLNGLCSDLDNDTLSFDLSAGSPAGDTILATCYSFKPTFGDSGHYAVPIIAKDPNGVSDTLTLNLTVVNVNRKPEFKPDMPMPSYSIAEGAMLMIPVAAIDPDTDPVTSFITGRINTLPRSSNLAITNDTVRWQSQINDTGNFRIEFGAADTKDTTYAVVNITVGNVNKPPVWLHRSITGEVREGQTITLSLVDSCKDADNDALSFLLLPGAPAGDTINAQNRYTYTPTYADAGTYTVKLVCSDNSLADTLSIALTVENVDTTVTDVTGPAISPVSGPTSGSVVQNPAVALTYTITDLNGIDSVYWTLNGDREGYLIAGAANKWSLKDTLSTFHSNTIIVIARDKSANRNICRDTTLLDYNLPPIINDTVVSTDRNTAKTWTLNAQSADGDTLAWSRLTSPSPLSGSLSGTLPSVTFTPAANWSGIDNFYVRVTDGYWSDTAKIKLTVVDVAVPPSIVTQPLSLTRNVGQSASFSVTVNADVNPQPSFQWKKNGADISGAALSSFTIGSVAVADSGGYSVTISNSAGTVTSQAAVLTVYFAPVITTQPQSQTLYLGQAATFTVVATGNPSPAFQWRKNGTAIASATNTSYTISSPGVSDSGKYTVTVMNSVDTVVSDTVRFYAVVKSVAAGGNHTLILKTDGTLWACGDNSFGQLGDGTTTDHLTPIQVTGITNVQSVAAGTEYSLILKNDSTLWGCGMNIGLLGDGTTTNYLTPVQASGVTSVQSMTAGGYHCLIIKSDGTLWASGSNLYGELGDGTTTDRTLVQITSINNVQSVVGGSYHNSQFLKKDGTLWACGYNGSGQLGDGTTTNRLTPEQVTTITNVQSIAEGGGHSLIQKKDGTLWACGYNGD